MKNSLLFILFGISSCFLIAMVNASETASGIKSSIDTVHPDYNGDNKAELVFRDIDRGLISVMHSSGGTFFNSSFGSLDSDMPVIGDFDGDGITDLAIRRLGSATWKVKNSSGSNFNSTKENGEQLVIFGRQKQDIPAIGDYDGDGISDFAVFRPSTQMWYVRNSSQSNYNSTRQDGIQRVQFGDNAELIPVPGDYDGDGISDMALFDAESGNWIIRYSSQPDTLESVTFGLRQGDIPVVADYDGDGITDVAIWNRGSFTWRINESSTGIVNSHQFGFYQSDIPIVADYDGDGFADLALYSRSDSFVNIVTLSDNQHSRFKVGGGNHVPVNAPPYLLMRLIEARDILLDTDGDGLSDYDEIVVYNTSPILRDTDGDGLSDYDEIYVYQTDPTNSDTDGDGLSDLIEVENSLEAGSATILPIDELLSGYTYLGYGSAVREGFTVARSHLEFAFLADSRFPVYKFNADFSGWVSSPKNSFSWSISDDDALVLNRFSGDAHDSFSDSTNPYNFHSVTPLDTIFDLSADDSGLQSFTDILNDIDNDNDFNSATATWYYQKTIKEIRLTPSTQVGDELNVEYTPTIEHRLTIPAEYRHYFAGKSELVGLEQFHKDHSRSLIFASQNPTINISPAEMLGDWVLPHIYQASAFELNFVDIVFSDDRHLNKLDRLTFTEQDASGEYSDFQFAWQVSHGNLILERNSERYEFRPFNRIGSRYQVEISHYDNNQLQRVYVGRLIKFNDSAASFINNPVLALPNVYMEQHWHQDSIDEQGLNFFGDAYSFKHNGSVDYSIRRNYSYEDNSEVFQSLFNAPYSLDHSGNTVTIENPQGVDINWQVLDVDPSGLLTYLDVDRTIRDSNNNGVIDDFELDPIPWLTVSQLAVEDLSRYGEAYENSAFNFAATQTVTMRMNLPANVVGLDVSLFDPDDPNTFHASTSVTIYDSLGGSHIQTFYFIRELDKSFTPSVTSNYWFVVSAVDGSLVNYTNADGINLTLPATIRVGHQSANTTVNNGGNGIAAGVLHFSSNGEFDNMLSPDGIQSVNNATTPPLVNFTTFTTEALGGVFGSGPDPTQQIRINFNLDIDGKEPTQFASPFEVFYMSQDGFRHISEADTHEDQNDSFIQERPVATRNVTMRMNLPANVAGLDVSLFDPDDPNTFHASTSVTIYDSLGASHIQTFYFIRELDKSIIPNETTSYWFVVSAVDGTLVNYTNAGSNLTLPAIIRVGHQSANNTVNNGGNGIAAGALKFNANGEFDNMLSPDNIESVNNATTPALVNFTTLTTEALGGVFGGGPDATQQIETNFNLNIDGKEPTQFASPFEVFYMSQDGFRRVSEADTHEDQNDTFIEDRPVATRNVTMRMNLPANVAGLDVSLFDPGDANTFHASTSVTIYDSLGGSHIQTFYFIRELDKSFTPSVTSNYWFVVSAVDGSLVNYTNADGINLTLPATIRVGHQSANTTVNNGGNGIAAGVLHFSSNGEFDNMLSPDGIQSVNNATTPPLVNFTTFTTEALGGVFGGGSDATQQIRINFNLDIDGKEPTQFASPFVVNSISQDGRAVPN